MRNFFIITKIRAVLLLSIFVFGTNTYAQEDADNDYANAITFGLVHSLNLASMTGTLPSTNVSNLNSKTTMYAPRVTFDVGMTMDYYINKKLSVQMDLVYSYLGTKLVTKTNIYNEVGIVKKESYSRYTTSYFKLPLTINFYPVKGIYANAGGYFSSLISASQYEHWYDNGNTIDDISPLDYGVIAGVGFNTPVVKVGFQYSYGLYDIINNDDYNLHHSVFQLILRWKFYSDLRKRNL